MKIGCAVCRGREGVREGEGGREEEVAVEGVREGVREGEGKGEGGRSG